MTTDDGDTYYDVLEARRAAETLARLATSTTLPNSTRSSRLSVPRYRDKDRSPLPTFVG